MLAVLCPGQGAQHPSMLDLLRDDAVAAAVLRQAQAGLAFDLAGAVADPVRRFENAVAQPAICIAQLAAWRTLEARVPRPLAFAGYSVGELASHACAGALDADALAQLASRRAALMDAAAARHPGGLIGLRGSDRGAVDTLCRESGVFVAIVLDATGYVLGGGDDALARARSWLGARNSGVTELKVGVPSHTPLLAEAVEPFREALTRSRFAPSQTAVVSGIDGAVRTERGAIIGALSRQLAHTVEWARCLDTLHERGCRVFLELGPGGALARMTRERFPDAAARCLDDFRSLAGAAAWVSGCAS